VFAGLVEEQRGELEDEGALNGEQVAEEIGRLVGAQGVQEHAQHGGQQARGVVSLRNNL